MTALSDVWSDYLSDLAGRGATFATHMRPGLPRDAVSELQPDGLKFPSELVEWFTLHQGSAEYRNAHVSGSWKVLSLPEALVVHEDHVIQDYPAVHGINEWRDSLFPFVQRDSAALFMECDPQRPSGVYYFTPWDCDAPVRVASSVADVVMRWRRLLSRGEIVVGPDGGLVRRSVEHLADRVDSLLA
jgi:hypothetical protein